MFKKPDPNIALDEEDGLKDREPEEGVETVVGPSVHVQGEFVSKGDIIVKGIVSGNVKTNRLLTVESDAQIRADVQAGSATISGEVDGSVSVADKLDITETAFIKGDISCKTLVVAPGAVINGKVNMDANGQEEMVEDVEEEYEEEEYYEEPEEDVEPEEEIEE